ncbi:unnamed protein product [Prunus brigantina]
MFLLEDWKIVDSVASGGPMNPPSIPAISMAADEEGSSSVEKKRSGSVQVQLEAFSVGADFFYTLLDETAWISSRHLEMATFLIRKRQLSHPLLFGTDWTTVDYALQQCLEPLKPTGKTRGSKKAAASTSSDLPANKLKNVHHFVHGTWQHGYAQAWKKVRKVYFPYNLRELQMSKFTPFSVCIISDVPQQ